MHEHMDQQMEMRKHRMALARRCMDTTRMWDLVAAVVEQANIQLHELQGKDAKKMRGRSKITFEKQVKSMLQGIEGEPEEKDFATRADWLRRLAQEHAAQGNRLINVSRRMKVGAKADSRDVKSQANHTYNRATFDAYIQKGEGYARKEHITEQQAEQIKANWRHAHAKGVHKKNRTEDEQKGRRWKAHW